MKNLLIVILLTAMGLFAESKAEYSIVIRPVESTAKAGSRIELEIKKTNTSNHTLAIGGGINPGGVYTYDVRRDGVLVPETEDAKNEDTKKTKEPRRYEEGSIVDSSLPPHRTATE